MKMLQDRPHGRWKGSLSYIVHGPNTHTESVIRTILANKTQIKIRDSRMHAALMSSPSAACFFPHLARLKLFQDKSLCHIDDELNSLKHKSKLLSRLTTLLLGDNLAVAPSNPTAIPRHGPAAPLKRLVSHLSTCH